jgi:hypothetical protein
MFIKDILPYINDKLAGEQLTFNELKRFMNYTVDDINARLHSNYPVFSDFAYDVDYNFFPDRYLRSVVAPGAAWYYYVADEEGNPSAQQHSQDYSRGLFEMQRDMMFAVPAQHRADSYQGTAQYAYDTQNTIEIPYGIGEW